MPAPVKANRVSIAKGILEIWMRDENGNSKSFQIPISDAMPVIFSAAIKLMEERPDSVAGFGEFHALADAIKKHAD